MEPSWSKLESSLDTQENTYTDDEMMADHLNRREEMEGKVCFFQCNTSPAFPPSTVTTSTPSCFFHPAIFRLRGRSFSVSVCTRWGVKGPFAQIGFCAARVTGRSSLCLQPAFCEREPVQPSCVEKFGLGMSRPSAAPGRQQPNAERNRQRCL